MIFLIVYFRIGHAWPMATLTDPAAPDKIKMPHWDILILYWLGQLDSNQH